MKFESAILLAMKCVLLSNLKKEEKDEIMDYLSKVETDELIKED